MTCYKEITRPECQSSDIIKAGFTGQKKQRYRCRNSECTKSYFILDYSYRVYLPDVKEKVVDMATNSSGIRDTARVLKISRQTVSGILKKNKQTG